MLKIIEPAHQCYYKARIDLFMGVMRLYQDISLTTEEQEQATFIIGEEDGCGVYGGSILQKRNVNDLQNQLKNIVSTLTPHRKEIWIGTLSYFAEDRVSPLGMEADSHRIFYKNLLEKFVEFGDIKETGYLCLTLNPFEHLRTKNRGFWPYIIEVKPQESLDGLFHGILPLSPRKDALYNSFHPTLPPSQSHTKLAA